MGTWCDLQKPSTLCPSISRGAVHPFGVRRTIMGHRARRATPVLRASCWAARISRTHFSNVAAIAWCMLFGSDPSTKYGVQP
jgi:hypothetical protein